MTGSVISVAMATCDGLPHLPQQLESILAQSRPAAEVVVCDDGSTDGTWEYLQRVAASDPRVSAHRNDERLGSTKNFERAIGLCRGDVIFLSDQDDVWAPDKVEALSGALEAAGAVLAMSNGQLVRDDGSALRVSLWQANGIDANVRTALQSPGALALLARKGFLTGSAFCFRASLKAHALPFPGGFWHDQWIALIAALVAPGRLVLLDRELYRYRQHAANQVGARLRWRDLATGWSRVWREVRMRDDLRRDARDLALGIEQLRRLEIAPGMGDVQVAIELLERRRRHALARLAYVEGQAAPWQAVARYGEYAALSHGARTLVRDVAARLVRSRSAGAD